MKDFFISYNQADRYWAEWVAWQLEAAGHTTVVQAWDFRPGSNFALEMHLATQEADRTIAILSPAFLESPFTMPEWAATFATDPSARKGKLIPVRVRPCDPSGVLRPVVYIDLVGLTEHEARAALLAGVARERAKPLSSPTFPGGLQQPTLQAPFPVPQPSSIRLLHLSDLHLGDERLNVFQRSAFGRLPGAISKSDRIDLVLVSGDLTSRGDLQGFRVVREFLLELLERLDLSVDQACYVVPGNHDVDWSAIGPADKHILDSLTSQEAVARVLAHPQTMGLLGSRLAGFYQFTELTFGRTRAWRPERPWRVDKKVLGGTRLAIVQLNSAWSLGPSQSTEPLLGEFQLRDALSEAADCSVRLWLVHHPLSTLRGFDSARVLDLFAATDGVDLVFSGHPHATFQTFSHQQGFLEVSAGWSPPSSARHEVPAFLCNVVEIDQGASRLRLVPFRYAHDNGTWMPDPPVQSGWTSKEGAPFPVEVAQPVRHRTVAVSKDRAERDYAVLLAIRSRQSDAQTSTRTLSETQFRKVMPSRPLLLMTATETELRAVLAYMRALKGRRTLCRVHMGKETYYLGRYGAETVIATMCGVGALGRDSVIIATQEAVARFTPKGIVMVGIAFGRDSAKQALGDVLVASQVISYEQQRIGQESIVQRGFIVETGPTLLNRFRQALDWTFTDEQGHSMKMHIGPVLSGEKLVDQVVYKKQLFRAFPQALGGEMEGAGLYAVAARSGLEWIVVKGICDWADGTKSDDAQPLAAASAASLVYHVLSDPTVLEALS